MQIGRSFAECRKKKRFATHARARRAARGLWRSLRDIVHPFKCACCGGWHLGGDMAVENRRDKPMQQMPYKRDKGSVRALLDEHGL